MAIPTTFQANDIDVTVKSLAILNVTWIHLRGSEDRMFIFGTHTERRERTLPRSWRMREAAEGDGHVRWKLTGRRYAHKTYPFHPPPRLPIATRC
ncbi:uncharacterized protein ARMOST_19596 [Armillaria ostoyae]|uniref:Uncharacterized protein n=1 Tax=Armillaria ostoyae TaxID=47428 RepID=A0A284S507_ARMOS|nr:uncharacterized protein ARMOST_19596 [Armillaria ostoyae]